MSASLRFGRPILLAVMASACTAVRAAECNAVDAMGWLLGEWQSSSGEKTIHERWWPQPPGAMEGVGRTMVDETVQLEERLRLEMRGDSLHYVADVSVNPDAVAFSLASCDEHQWTFENPAHDFPQRILYRRTGPESFLARVSDLDDQGFQLAFERLPSGR